MPENESQPRKRNIRNSVYLDSFTDNCGHTRKQMVPEITTPIKIALAIWKTWCLGKSGEAVHFVDRMNIIRWARDAAECTVGRFSFVFAYVSVNVSCQ